MKAVLISINPLWCELIGNGEKTIEVRKNRPKLKTPFKVFIYCTKAKTDGEFIVRADKFSIDFINNINGTDVEVIGNKYDNPKLMEIQE